jgi:hypothetical protein
MRLLILAVFAMASVRGADEPATFNPIQVFRGDTVTLVADGLELGKVVQLSASNTATDPPTTVRIAANPTSATNLAFAVPPTLSFGRWEMSATDPVVIKSTPKTIEVKARVPKIDAVSPKVLYLPNHDNRFTVIGSGFTEGEKDYYLHFLDAQSPARCDTNHPAQCYNVAISPDHQQITFSDIPGLANYAGKRRFTVSVGGMDSNAAEVTFSEVKDNTPRYWALAMLAGIILTIYVLLRAGKKNVEHKIDDHTYFLTALFLDKETNTYSLSQCQFYAWTGASILGYIYLATAKSMIQGSMAFPDIPAGLPGILLASAATTVLAAGITNSKGNKGAGEIHPSLADFISAGGVVAAERLQFVVWTIVGVVTFVRLVFLSDPATIDGLPQIPDGFLQLMGISSAGYIGGKLARKAGPTITAVTAVGNADELKLDIKGVGLSQNANFSIGDDVVPPAQIQGDKNLPEIVQKDDTNSEQGFATLLRLNIVSPKPAWLGADAKVTVTNPDRQAAAAKYSVAPPPVAPTAPPAEPPATQPVPPGISTTTLLDGDATGQAAYNQKVEATGGTPPYVWSVTPALPEALDLNKDTGEITGTPKAPAPRTTYKFQVKDSTGASATSDIQIAVT